MGLAVKLVQELHEEEFGQGAIDGMVRRQPNTYILMTYTLMQGGGEIDYKALGISRKAYRSALTNLADIPGFSIRKNFKKGEEGGHQGGQGRFAVSIDFMRLPEILKNWGATKGATTAHTPASRGNLITLKRLDKSNPKETASPKLAEREKKWTEEFKLFWYGPKLKPAKGEGILKKVDVSKARQAFLRMRKNGCELSATELTKLFNQHYREKFNKADGHKFVKHPSTWLNAGSYEDEVPVAKTQTDAEPWLTDERFGLWLQINEYPDRPETLSDYYDIYTHDDDQ